MGPIVGALRLGDHVRGVATGAAQDELLHVIGDPAGGGIEGVHDVLDAPGHAHEHRNEAVVAEEQRREDGVANAREKGHGVGDEARDRVLNGILR